MYYRTCPDCGAHLDPGERCAVHANKKRRPRCANIRDGKEKKSTYIISRARGVVKDD